MKGFTKTISQHTYEGGVFTKKWTVFLAALVLLISVLATGCGLTDKIGEKIGEKILGEITSDNVDIDLDGDSGMTITTSDGQMQTGSDLSWPTDSIGDIPKIDATFTGVFTGQGSATVYYEKMKTDVTSYVESLKSLGYTNDTYDIKSGDGSITFTGTNDSGASVGIFHSGNGTGWITYTLPKESE